MSTTKAAIEEGVVPGGGVALLRCAGRGRSRSPTACRVTIPEAVPPLEAAVKLEPRNPAAHYNLAMAYNRSGRKQDADREFAIHRQMTEKSGAQPGSPAGIEPEDPN